MKWKLGLLALILASFPSIAHANPPIVWGATGAELLQPGICGLKEVNCLLYGTLNPSSTAVSAPEGSLYLSTNGSVYVKQDAGLSTNWDALGSSGATVTSVGLSAPSWLTVSGSPVTSSGTLALTGTSETANYFLAAPNGSSGAMTPRAIVAADIPTLNQDTTGNAATATALASAPTACSGANFATGIGANGDAICSTPAGSGTVTSVSVASANGFAGTVANATTTPAITMETSITGLLHGSGTAVAAETVSSPLNESSGTLSCLTASGSQAGCLSSTDWATFNDKQSTLTFSDSLVNSSGTVTLSGDTASPGDSQYYGTDSGGTLGYFDLPGSGVTTVGTFGSQSSSANGAVISGSDIYFQDFTSSNPGMAPASGGGTTNFLRADGSWAAPSGSSGITELTGDVTAGPGSGSQAASLVATSNSTLTTLSGLTTAGSLSTVGTITSGTWEGDPLGIAYGGTNENTQTNNGVMYFDSSGITSTSGFSYLSGTLTAPTINVSGLTASEAVVTDGSKNLASLPYSTTPGASTLAEWDANSNLSANAMVQAYATTATAGSTTTLTVASAPIQYFTGSDPQTIVLPVVSTLPQTGFTYSITNNSTGLLTVESSGGNVISTVPGGATGYFTCILVTGTTAASWNGLVLSNSALNYPTFSVNTSTTAGSTSANLVYSVTENDSAGGYSSSTGAYTIPSGHGGMWHLNSIIYAGSTVVAAQITDNSTIICTGAYSTASATAGQTSCDYPVSAGDVIKVFPSLSATASGPAQLNVFSGFQIITSQAQPIGNVTSTGAGQYHTESAIFGGNSSGTSVCSSDPCTYVTNSGTGSQWAIMDWASTGDYTINFTAGEFASGSHPKCDITPLNISTNNYYLSQSLPSSTSWTFLIRELSSLGTDENDGFMISCSGPH